MKRSLLIAVMVCALFWSSGQALADKQTQSAEVVTNIEQINRLIGQAMTMVTQGANLVLTSSIGLTPPTDPFTAQQGMKMIQNGKDLVNMALSGEGMSDMQKKDMEANPMMTETRKLGESVLRYIDLVENMKLTGTVESKIKLHQVQATINHAVNMAADGANLAMLGNLKLAAPLDKFSVERGHMMIKDARATLESVSGSETMKVMNKSAMESTDKPMMTVTNELIQTALKIIDSLDKLTK